MIYEANYTRPYPNGYENVPSKETPVMAEALNAIDSTIIKIEQFLANLDIGGDYALLTEAGYSLGLEIDSNYVMTISLKNKADAVLDTKNIDFPIESMVVNATYENGKITLTLQNGNTLDIDISDMVRGLVPTNRTIAGIDLEDDIDKEELKTALGIYDSTVVGGEIKPWLYDTSGKEVIVGVYNGKPLYRRFFYANLTTTNNNVDVKLSDYVDNFSDIELLIDYIIYTPTQNRLPINYISSGLQSSSAMGFISVSGDVIRINHGDSVSFNNANFRIMIEYTKKTDAEGSGNKLNPYGIYDAIVEGFLSKEDVVDNLLGTATDLPLSANQGQILNKKIEDILKTETLSFADVFTISTDTVSNITVEDSAITKRGKHIWVDIGFKGSIVSGAGGITSVLKIKSAYRPIRNFSIGIMVNGSTSGQVYKPASLFVASRQNVNVVFPSPNETYGNDSYPWSTTSWLKFDWEIE